MSLSVCISGLIAEGKIRKGQAQEADRLYGEYLRDLEGQIGMMAAAQLASERTIAALRAQQVRKELLAALTIKTRERILSDLRGYNGGGTGPLNPKAGPALIDHDPRARFSNVEGRRKAIKGQAHRMMVDILADHSANLVGQVRGKARLTNIVREAFGENSGDAAAKELAGAWGRTAEMLRKRFNAAGGDIGKLDDWGLPQGHDWRAVRSAGFDAWREQTLPRLDRAKMIDRRTGQPFTDSAMDEALKSVFATIRSNGIADMTPGAVGKGAMANRHADERFLKFKSANDWMAYAEEFGSGSPYDAMMGHIDRMARDIAAVEILGPNPANTVSWIKDSLAQSAAINLSPKDKDVGAARSAGKRIDELWAQYTGAANEPRNERLALAFSSVRAFQTATKLGSAYLSAGTDFGFQASRRAFNGLPQVSVMRDYLKLMRPGSIEDQKLAVRRGLIAEEWGGRTAAQNRYMMEELTGEIPRRLAEGVLRLSLLSRHTQTMRWAYGMEVLATYTEQAGKSFDNLEPALRGALQRYGIGAGGWDKLRTAPMETDRGVEWLTPANSGDNDLASKFMEMILEETDLAVPTADLSTRATLSAGTERGTWVGEGLRSALLFKSFGVSVVINQVREILAMSGVQAGKYAGGLVLGTTLLGGLALQLKALASGKDPRPMNDEKFWGAAMLQGGGFGIFGDFLSSSTNRFGGGFAQTLAGPLVDDAQGLVNIGKAKKPGRAAVRELKGFIPGSSLWYGRLAFDRMVADQIQEAIDPEYRKSWRRMAKAADEQGTQFWWEPGEALPDRAPDLTNAGGGAQ